MWKRWAVWLIKLSFTGAAVWYLQKNVDLRNTWDVGKRLPLATMAAVFALLVIHIVICAARWSLVVRAIGGRLSLLRASVLFCIGNFFGQVLPSNVGSDAIRLWETHKAGLSLRISFNSIALDRIVTVFGLVVLVTITQPLLLHRLPYNSGVRLFQVLLAVSAIGIVLLASLDKLPQPLRHSQIVRSFMVLAEDSRRLLSRPRYAISSLALTLLAHVNLALVVWVLGFGLGAQVSVLECVVLFSQVVLVTILPISIGGWGVREAAMVALFGFVGISPAQATAMSVLFGVAIVVMALPGGVFWLFTNKGNDLGGK